MTMMLNEFVTPHKIKVAIFTVMLFAAMC